MGEFKTWLEALEAQNFEPLVMEMIINEMPHTHFMGPLPQGFEFLKGGFVDLGFENLGLSPPEQYTLNKALAGTGIAIPGTRFKIRSMKGGDTQVLPIDGSEIAALPPHWKQAVYVVDNDNYTWIGKRVRPDQVGQVDLSLYDDEGNGYKLIKNSLVMSNP